jgi:hypothetical protein
MSLFRGLLGVDGLFSDHADDLLELDTGRWIAVWVLLR